MCLADSRLSKEGLLGGGGSGGCARGTDTSSRPSAWSWPRSNITQLHGDRGWPGPGEGARVEVHGRVPVDAPSQVAGAVYYEMDTGEDDGSAPAAGRPAPLMEVLPQAGVGRHGGIGYELVLSSTVPQGFQEAETALHVFLKMVKEREEAKAKEKEKAAARKVTVQEILEVQGEAPSRTVPPQKRNSKRIAGQEPQAIPQERISEQIGGGKVPRVIPPRRISERIQKPIVDVPGQDTPQARTSERIHGQIVDVPGQSFPQKQTSKRIEEQIVDNSGLHDITQERISERIEGRIEGNPSTSSSAAAALNSAEWLGDRGFRTFSPHKKKCEVYPPVECEHAVALELMDAGGSSGGGAPA